MLEDKMYQTIKQKNFNKILVKNDPGNRTNRILYNDLISNEHKIE